MYFPESHGFFVCDHTKEYLTEQTRLYGTNHIYGIDPFNEIDPPSWDADSLGMMAKHIYESVAAVDPEAVWLQMTWLFYADIKHWILHVSNPIFVLCLKTG
ncbi:hypothetical protein NXX19_28080 [Bacteroides ovatus]|nr:hypothetical protein [Bacteroides ovatus]